MDVHLKHVFSVNTKGTCVLCLAEDCTILECSFQNISSHLRLDFRKIFNITSATFLDGNESDNVDIMVPLCRSCSGLRSKFCELYDELKHVEQRLKFFVQTLQDVMINAESNVIRVRRYRDKTGTCTEAGAKKPISDRFREELVQTCTAYQVQGGHFSAPGINSNPTNMGQKLVWSTNAESPSSTTTTKMEENDENFGGVDVEELDEADEEEDDPETLMMKYNSRNCKRMPDLVDNTDKCDVKTKGNLSDSENADNAMEEEELMQEEDRIYKDEEPIASTSSNTPDKIPSFFNSKFGCKICGKTVVGLKNLELHQRRHAGVKPFECQHCKQTFRDTSNLRSHVLRNHQNVLFARFRDRSMVPSDFRASLEKLVRSVTQCVPEALGSGNSQKCGLCDKEYSQKSVMEDHVIQRHYDVLATCIRKKVIQEKITMFPPEEIFSFMVDIYKGGNTCSMCGVCGKDCGNGSRLNNHIKEHIKVKVTRNSPPNVPTNGRASSSLITLKMKCSACGQYFDNLSALNKHNEVFQGKCGATELRQVSYTCKYCGKNFCSYYSQRSHLMSIHRYIVLSKYLPKGTTLEQMTAGVNSILKNHKKLPTGLFQCGMCSKQITQLRKLHAHVMVSHFDDVVSRLRDFIVKSHQDLTDTEDPSYDDIGSSYHSSFKNEVEDCRDFVEANLSADEEMNDPSSMLQIVYDYEEPAGEQL